MKTYYGIKKGMSQVWTKSGLRLPVTIIKADPMVVTQVKTKETDGYIAVQVGIGTQREKTMTNPLKGHVAKAKVTPRSLREIRLSEAEEISVGQAVTIDTVLKVGDIVHVTGESKGRGFSGPMKRWGFHGGPKTHGQSDRWRAPGSIGQGTNPGRVLKGRHMAGRYGGETYEVKNLQVIKVDTEKQEIWLNGPVPGARNAMVSIEVKKESTFEGLQNQDAAPAAAEPQTGTKS